MKKEEREKTREEYLEIYKKSWTFERLSKDEKEKIIEILQNCPLFGNNVRQVCEQLRTIYSAFLEALNYQPIGWRGD